MIGTPNRKKAVIYTRVSESHQVDGYSLDAQERYCIDYCEKMGWVPTYTYREEGVSARYDVVRKRPVFQQLLNDAAEGKFDVVIIHTLDRWARSLKVTLESLAILGQHDIGFVSITENLDYTTPYGKLTTQMLGGMAEYFSNMLAIHTKKGIDERARRGKHLGSIPFGYESCWKLENKEKIQVCKPEHPGGIHIQPAEGPAITRLFKSYASGTATLSSLATYLNDEGFRTRNTKKLPDAEGNLIAEPRLFTTASVKGILHNPIYTGKIKHREQLHQGLHEPLLFSC